MSGREKAPNERRSFFPIVVGLITALAGLATITGLSVTNVLGDHGSTPPQTTTPTSAQHNAEDPSAFPMSALSKLSDDEQLNHFETALGEPHQRKQLGNYTMTTWTSPDLAVVAYSDALAEVVAYTVTVLSPDVHPSIAPLPGDIHLGSSVFADVTAASQSAIGNYPANAHWSYAEMFYDGNATDYKHVVLAASWTTRATDGEGATDLRDLSECIASSLFVPSTACPDEKTEPVRNTLQITSATIGERNDLEAIDNAGAEFFAEV